MTTQTAMRQTMAQRPARRRVGTETLRRRVERLIASAIVICLSLIIGVGVGFDRSLDAQNFLLDRIDEALIDIESIQNAQSRQQSALRGLAISGLERFADQYDLARADEEAALTRLVNLSATHQPARSAAIKLREASQAWHEAAVTVAILGGEEFEVTPQTVLAGEIAFDRITSMAQAAETTARLWRVDVREDLRRDSRQLAVAVIVFAVTLLGFAFRIWYSLRKDVLAPLNDIAVGAAAVAKGDLHRVVETEGPPEILAMASDVEAMRRRMLDDLDVTRQAQIALEDQALALQDQARELQASNAELERFAYVASHDLQEPLRKIASFCELLQRRYGDQLDERAETYIAYAVDGAHRMQALIQDLLEFSRVGRRSAGFERTPMRAAVDDALNSLALQVEDTGAVVKIGELPTIDIDRSMTTQLFQNLLGNAMKFHGEAAPVIEVDATPVGDDEWCFRVKDNGIGIEPEYADQVFELFQRLHERDRYEGTGIGLALCRKIVDFHGGRIWVDDEAPGPGTTITFTLPARAADDEHDLSASADEATTAPSADADDGHPTADEATQ